MCEKNHLLIFSSFLDIWENVDWPRFFLDHPVHVLYSVQENVYNNPKTFLKSRFLDFQKYIKTCKIVWTLLQTNHQPDWTKSNRTNK